MNKVFYTTKKQTFLQLQKGSFVVRAFFQYIKKLWRLRTRLLKQSALVALAVIVTFGNYQSGPLKVETAEAAVVTFATPGGTTWTAPAGVTSVTVEAWGAGGGGGGSSATNPGGGGGGAGGNYGLKVVTVVPDTTYTVVVGTAGAAGAATAGTGGTGGDSMFSASSTFLVKGGGGGALGPTGAAGASSTGDVATTVYFGGRGAAGAGAGGSGAGGGGAGDAAHGGNANGTTIGTGGSAGGGNGGVGVTVKAVGNPGATYGGGGSGGFRTTGASYAGGLGGDGYVKLTYTLPSTVLSGTLYSDEGGTPITAGRTINVAIGTTTTSLYTTTSNGSGVWTVSVPEGNEIGTSTPIVVWVDNATEKATLFTKASSTNTTISGLDLYQNRVIVRHEATSGTTTTNANMEFYDGDNDSDIQYTSNGGALSVRAGNKLFIWANDVYAPGGPVTVNGNAGTGVDGSFHIGTGATYTAGATTTIAGNFSASSTATFTPDNFNLLFNATTTGKTIDTVLATLGTTTFNGVGGAWSFTRASATTSNLTITNGTLTAPTADLIISGNYANAGTFTAGSGTTTLSGTIAQTLSGTLIGTSGFNHLAFTGAGTKTFSSSASTTGNLLIAASSGAVTAPSSLTIAGNYTNSGTFTAGTGTTTFSGASAQTLSGTLAGTSALSHVVFQGAGTKVFSTAGASTTNLIIEATAGALTAPAYLAIAGNYTNNGTFTAGSGTTTFSGTSAQTATGTLSGTSAFNNLAITNSSATTTFGAPLTVSGHFKATTPLSILAFVSGGTTTLNTAHIIGTAGNTIKLRSLATGTQTNLDINGAYLIDYVDVKDNNACATAGSITYTNGTDSGNNTCWTFGVTISGLVYSDEGTTLLTTGPTVRIKVNGAGEHTAVANGSGAYTISGLTLAAGQVITAYLDGDASNKATTITRASSTDGFAGLNLYKDHIIVRTEDAGPMTIDNLDFYDKGNDADILFTATNGAPDTLVVDAGNTLYIMGTTTVFTPGGTVTANGPFKQVNGTFNGGANTIDINNVFTLAGGTFNSTSGTLTLNNSNTSGTLFSVTGGTYNHNNGTTTFTSGGGSHVDQTIDVNTSLTLYNVLLNGLDTGDTFTVASGDVIVVANTLTHTSGALGGAWESRGNVIVGSGADGGSGTISFLVAGNQTISGNGGMTGGLSINKPSGNLSAGSTDLGIYSFALLSGEFISTSGTLTVGSLSNSNLTIFSVSPGTTFSHNNGTIAFASAGGTNAEHTFDVATSLTLYNVTVSLWDPNDIFTVASGDTIIVTNNFTHTDGVLNGTIEAQGNVVIGVGADGGNATLTFTGGNAQTYTDQGGNEPDGDIRVQKSAGTLTLASNADWNAASQDFTIASGTVDTAGFAINGSGTGALSVSNGATLIMSGDSPYPLAFGSYTYGATSTVRYAQNVPTTTTAATYGHLEVMPGADATTHTFPAGTTVVNGQLTLGNGTNAGAVVTAATNATVLDVNGSTTIAANTTFVANDTNSLTIAGNFTNNGTFTATAGTTTFDGTSAQALGGTMTGASAFNHVVLTGASTKTFSNVASSTNFTINAGATAVAPAELSISGHYNNLGTLTAGTGTTTFSGTTAQTATGTLSGTSAFNNLVVTNSIATTTFGAPVAVTNHLALNTPSTTVALLASATSTIANLTITGTSGNEVKLRSTTPDTKAGLMVTGSYSVSYADIKDSSASSTSGLITVTSGIDGGNTNGWTFGGVAPGDTVTISGVLYEADRVTPVAASQALVLAVATSTVSLHTTNTTVTTGAFTFTIDVGEIATATPLTVYVDGNAALKAVTVTKLRATTTATSIMGINLYKDHISVRSEMTASTSAANNDLNSGLVGYWAFDGAEIVGTQVKDLSGGQGHGTLTNMEAADRTTGKIGSALSFDGVDERVQIDSTFGLGTTNAAVSLWAYIPALPSPGAFIKIGGTSDGYGIGISNGGTSGFETSGSDLTILFEAARWIPTGISPGTGWHHFVLVIDGSGVPNVYKDGAFVGSYSGSTAIAPTTVTNIGGYTSSVPSNRHFNGRIDDVRIYNRTLTQDEITRLYTLSYVPTVTNVDLAHYDGDDDSDIPFIASSTVPSLTISSPYALAIATSTVFAPGGAVTVNGNGSSVSATDGSLYLATSSIYAAGGTTTLAGSFYASTSSSFVPGNYTITMNATTTGKTIMYASSTLGTTTFNGVGGSWTFGTTSTTSNLMITNGTVVAPSTRLAVTGDFSNSGTYNAGAVETTFNSAFPQGISGSLTGSSALGNISFLDAGTKTFTGAASTTNFTINAGATAVAPENLTIAGNYQNNGTFSNNNATVTIASTTAAQGIMGNVTGSSAFSTLRVIGATTTGTTSGMVGKWMFEEGSGTTVRDASGNGNIASITGAAWTTGNLGRALSFDGAGDYADLATAPSVSSTGGFTYSLWINPRSYVNGLSNDGSGTYFLDRTVASNPLVGLKAIADKYAFQVRYSDGTGLQAISTSNNITLNQWTHITLVRSYGSNFHIYRDGVLSGSGSGDGGSALAPEPVRIGAHQSGTGSVDGMMDDFRIYNRALSASEISDLYNERPKVFSQNASTTNLIIESGVVAAPPVLTIAGDYTNSGAFLANSGTTTFSGISAQTATGTMTATSTFHNLVITNNTATTTFGAALTVTGNFVATTPAAKIAFAAGATTTLATATITGSSTATTSLRSTSAGTQWNLAVTGSYNLSYIDVKDSNACGSVGGGIDVSNSTSTNSGNNTCWTFGGVAPGDTVTISGVLYESDRVTPVAASQALVLAVATSTVSLHTTNTTVTTGAFTFTIDVGEIATATPLTVYVDGNASLYAVTVTKAASTTATANVANLHLYQNHVAVKNEAPTTTSTSTTIADLALYDSSDDADIQFTASSTYGGSLSLAAGQSLYVTATSTFLSGSTTVPGNVLTATTSTLIASTSLTVAGNFHNAGTYTTAGAVWNAASSSQNNSWYSVTYGNGIFVAVSSSGTNRVMTSPDGINWTAQSAAGNNDYWEAVTYGNGLFVAVGDGNQVGGGDRVMISSDGITWNVQSASEAAWWTSVTYGNGLFVAVAQSGTNRVMTSTNGEVWTAQTAAEANIWRSITYGNGLFAAVSTDGTNRVMTSPNGIAWTAQTAAATNQWRSVTYGNGLFVAVAQSGTNRVMTSPNGVAWTIQTGADTNSWRSVTYGNGLFVAVSEAGTNRVMTSPDGIIWTARTAPGFSGWYSVIYGKGRFVAVAYGGDVNLVMTSAVSTTTFSGASAQSIGGSLVGASALGNVAMTGAGTKTFSANASTTNFVVEAGATLVAPATSLTIHGNYTNSGTFTAGANTTFAGSLPQTVNGTLTGTSAFRDVNVKGETTFLANASTTDFTVGAYASATAPTFLSIAGNYENAGTFRAGAGTVIMASSSPANTYTGFSFDTAGSGNGLPFGITVYNGYFYATDATDAEVYKYNIDGTYTGTSFDTSASGNAAPRGITVYDGYFWVTDDTDAEVYKYNIDGTYTGTSFDTNASGNADPRGIVYANNFFWVTDIGDYEVYKYNIDGTYTGISFDTAGAGNNSLYGITYYNNYFWIADDFDAKVYRYATDGTYTGYSFNTAGSGNGVPSGVIAYNGYIWVTDYGDAQVYQYTAGQGLSGTMTGTSTFNNLIMRGSAGKDFANNASTSNLTIEETSGEVRAPALLSIAGNYTNSTTTGFNANSGTTTLSGTSAQTATGTMTGTSAFNHLALTGGGVKTFVTNASTTNFTVNSGATAVAPAELSVSGQYLNNGTTTSAGATWTARQHASTSAYYGVAYGNGIYVAVGTGATMRSADGITWASSTPAEYNAWKSVTYGNGLFVAVTPLGTNRVMTSPDGITWTARVAANTNYWQSVTYGNGLFVAVSTSGTGNRVMTSPDGIVWTGRTSSADQPWSAITYGNGLFVAVSSDSSSNLVMTSPDGVTWTSRTPAANYIPWQSVTYGNGLFVAGASSGSGNRLMTSPNGITWTSRAGAADNQWYSITYGNGLFVAVSSNFDGTINNRVMTSPDGITWDARTAAQDSDWNSITYGNGRFVAVSLDGTNRVMTSDVSTTTFSGASAQSIGGSLVGASALGNVAFTGAGTKTFGANASTTNFVVESGATAVAPATSLTITGDYRNSGTFTAGSGTTTFIGGTAQTATGTMTGTSAWSNVDIKNTHTSTSTTFGNNVTVSGHLKNNILGSKLAFTPGVTATTTTLTITGSSTATTSLRSTTAGTQFNLAVTGSYNLSYIDVKDSNACNSVGGGIDVSNSTSTNSGNTTCWTFTGAAPGDTVTISGVLYESDRVTPVAASQALVLAVATSTVSLHTTNTTVTTGAFTFSITAGDIASSTPLTVFVDGNATLKAVTVTKAQATTTSSAITNLPLYKNHLIVKHEATSGTSTTISDLSYYDNDNDSDIPFTATTTAGTSLTVSSPLALLVASSSTFAPGGAVTVRGNASTTHTDGSLHLAPSSTYTAGGNTTLAGSFTASSSAVFNPGSYTTTLNATTTGKTLNTPFTTYGHLTMSGSGGAWSFAQANATTSDLTINTGATVVAPAESLTVVGSFTQDGSFDANGGTLYFDGLGSHIVAGSLTETNALSDVVFMNSNTAFGTQGGVTTDPTSGNDQARGITSDATTVYVTGYRADGGALGGTAYYTVAYAKDTGATLWATTTDPTSGNDIAQGITSDTTAVYVTGYRASGGALGLWAYYTVAYAKDTGATLWATTTDPTSGNDQANGITSDATTVYVTGYRASGGALGGNAYYTVAYAKDTGATLWATTTDPTGGNDISYAITINDAAIFVTGARADGGALGLRAYYTVAYDKDNGATLWATTTDPSSGSDYPYAIASDTTTVYVTGYRASGGASGGNAYYTVAYDAVTGATLWATTTDPSSGNDQAYGIVSDSTTVYVTGYCNSCGTLGSWAYYTIAYDKTDSSFLWATATDPTSGGDYATGITSDATTVYVTGYRADGGALGGNAYYTVAYAKDTGATLWATTTDPTSGNDVAYGITSDATAVYVTGYCTGCGALGGFAYYTVAYAKDTGATLWATITDPASGSDKATGITSDATTVYVTGYRESGGISGSYAYYTVAYDKEDGGPARNPSAVVFDTSAVASTDFAITNRAATAVAPTDTLTITGDYENVGRFVAGSGTTTFSGSAAQTATGTMTGTSAFNTLALTGAGTKTFSTAASTTNLSIQTTATTSFSGAVSGTTLTVVTPAAKVAFAAGATSTFDTVTIAGTAGNEVRLRSTVPDTKAGLALAGAYTITYADIKDSSGTTSAGDIDVSDGTSIDSQNNNGWNFGEAGENVMLVSATNQTFTFGDAATAISPITITDATTPTITAVGDIRISIATTTVNMRFDTTDTSATLSGTGAGKVSATVSYEGAGSVLIIDVTENFAAGDTLIVSGLSYTNFNTVAPPTQALTLHLDGNATGTPAATDTRVISIVGSLTLANHTEGQVNNGFSATGWSDIALYRFALTPAGESALLDTLTISIQGANGVLEPDLNNFRLYRDVNSNGTLDGGDILLNGSPTISLGGQSGTIAFALATTTTATTDFLLIGDVDDIRPSDQMNIQIAASGVVATGVTTSVALTTEGAANRIQHNRGGSGTRNTPSLAPTGGEAPEGNSVETGGGQGGGSGEVDTNTGGDTLTGLSDDFKAPGAQSGSWTTGTNGINSDGSYATAASAVSHTYTSFNFAVPDGNQITGIEVKLEASATSSAGDIGVRLSWNNGSSFSGTETTPTLSTTDTVYTLGGAAALWGHGWTPADTTDGNFQLEVTANPDGNTVKIDAIRVRIHHQTTGGGQGGGSGEARRPGLSPFAGSLLTEYLPKVSTSDVKNWNTLSAGVIPTEASLRAELIGALLNLQGLLETIQSKVGNQLKYLNKP